MAVLRKKIKGPRPPAEYDPNRAAADALALAQSYTVVQEPLAVFELAAALGITVNKRPLPEGTSGYFRKTERGWEIGVNSLHHPHRQRFTVAHELGHYFLHRDSEPFEDGLLFRRENQINRKEREANEFAALLLMPAIEFRQAIGDGDIENVAARFGVSRQAAEFRRNAVLDQLPID
ncbi:MAG TPA: ImmA/IrrE family metallo-endopeptidase [Devosia sp.]